VRNQHEVSANYQTGSRACFLLHAGFSLGLFLYPEDGGEMFFLIVGLLSTDYMVLHFRRQNSLNKFNYIRSLAILLLL
jgi:hypothetical protein